MINTVKPHIFFYCVACILLLGGCKNIEHVFLENNTNEIIIVQVYLSTKNGEQIMEASINPNDSDGWSYETDIFESEEIDKKFTQLIITNNKGCKTKISRNDMKSLASKSGAWKLVIDKNIMTCD